MSRASSARLPVFMRGKAPAFARRWSLFLACEDLSREKDRMPSPAGVVAPPRLAGHPPERTWYPHFLGTWSRAVERRPSQAAILYSLLPIFSFRVVGDLQEGERGVVPGRFCAPLLCCMM